MSKKVWLKRTPEWLKNNPGQGTMYKADLVTDVPEESFNILTKEAKKQFKRGKRELNDMGIYLIVCEPAKRVYVGQSINVGIRMRSHKMFLLGKRENVSRIYHKMLEDVAKYGANSFEFKKHLAVENIDDLVELETITMYEFLSNKYDLYNTLVPSNLYCPDGIKDTIAQTILKAIKDPYFLNSLKLILENKLH